METEKIKMSQLGEGECGTVTDIAVMGELRGRLTDLGLVPGTCVCCLRRAPAGSPIIYNICGAMVAIRVCDAENIELERKIWD